MYLQFQRCARLSPPPPHQSPISTLPSALLPLLLQVTDPYYGGEQGFEDVLDLVQGAADNLLDKILKDKGLLSTIET